MTNYRTLITTLSTIFITTLSTQSAFAGNSYSIGVEGFYDNYQEPDLDMQVDEHAKFASVDLAYDYTWSKYFAEFSARASYGKDDYKSLSGTIDGITQYEGEFRVIGGVVPSERGFIQPYYGFGTRIFYDNSKDLVTDTGALGYDRRITQFYAPIGLWYQSKGQYFDISSKGEFDIPLFGIVNTRFQNLGGPDVVNYQRFFKGYGLRGEVMLGKTLGKYTLQAGPFVRYWHYEASDITVVPGLGFGEEPKNDRLQAGAQIKVLW